MIFAMSTMRSSVPQREIHTEFNTWASAISTERFQHGKRNLAFPQHPDAEIILSFPGLGIQLGARVLAEIGDDCTRFADACGLKAYAGASPITAVTA